MSSKWYVDPEDGPVAAEDDAPYDEAFGPGPVTHDHGTGTARIVEDDEGAHPDLTKEAVAHEAAGDAEELSAEEAAMHYVDEDVVAVDEGGSPDTDDEQA